MILRTLTKDGKQDGKIQGNNETFLFFDDKGICQYQNFTQVEKIEENHTGSNKIKISNRLCKQNGEFMEKSTVIKFNNEIITIKDLYKFTSQGQHSNDPNMQKRVQIFKKTLHTENKGDGKKWVTKNLPKNFIKAFLNYLQSIKDERNAELLQCKIKLLTSQQKYNNSFIQRIVDDSDLQPFFVDFLNNYAKDWIQHSKIRDKEVHYQAIQIFKQLSQNKDKRQSKSSFFDDYLQSFQQQSLRISASRDINESDKQSIMANSSKNQNQDEI